MTAVERSKHRPLRILVAEDLDNDIELLQLAFSKASPSIPLHFVKDGEEAIQYLNGDEAFSDRTAHPLPAMLLLDLKMPRIDGFQVLGWLRSRQDELRRLPVIVFTSSSEPEDIKRAYDLGANSYLVKPSGTEEMAQRIRCIETFWLCINRFPNFAPPPAEAATKAKLHGEAILLVEDSPNDVELIRRAFRKAGFDNPLQTVVGSVEAIQYLKGTGLYADRVKFPIPSLILLDHQILGEPYEVLRWVRQHPQLKSLPIVFLSGSDNPNNERNARDLGANGYYLKSQDFQEFAKTVAKIGHFWLSSNLDTHP